MKGKSVGTGGSESVVGNAEPLHILMSVLISNAHKHGGTELLLSTTQNDGGVSLHVVDNGPGIDPVFNEKIFQINTTLKPRDFVEGSGVGLAIARKL